MKQIVYISALALMVALTACREGCYQPTRSLMGVAFLDSVTRKPANIQIDTVKGVESDSVLYSNVSVTAIYLPLHITKDTTKYSVKFKRGEAFITDTLTVFHTMNTQFLSPECGCVPYFSIDSFYIQNNGDFFRSIELYNSEVKNIEQDVHVKIFIYN